MARVRSNNEVGVNLDSLMDALTNVVGILIIVFVLVQLKVTKVVERDLENVREVTPEQLSELQKQVEEENKALVVLLKQREEADRDALAITKTLKLRREERIRLANSLKMNIDFEAEEKLRQEIAKLETELVPVEKKESDLGEERKRLAGLLANTEPAAPPPALQIRMPNPRPIPKDAVVYNFWVAPGRIVYLDPTQYREQFEEEFTRLLNSDKTIKLSERKPGGNRKPIPVYDGRKVAAYMNERARLGNRDIDVNVHRSDSANRLYLRLSPAENGAETVDAARKTASQYQRALRKIKSEGNAILMFHVDRKAIETYLDLRRYADATGVPAGWKLQWNPFYQTTLTSIEVKVEKPRPPPDPNAPKTFTVRPPSDSLD